MGDWVEEVRKAAREALPPVEGEIDVPGLRAPVEVVRDRWGVPHVFAEHLEDLFLAQGFLVASERLFQTDLLLRTANGRLAALLADPALPMDRFARTLGWPRAAGRIAAGYDDLSATMVDAFLAGLDAWLDAMPAPPPEYRVLALEPGLPREGDRRAYLAAGGVLLAWTLSGNWDLELLRAQIASELGIEAAMTLVPGTPGDPPVATADTQGARAAALELLRAGPPRPAGQGSNNWAVGGSRSVTGKPLLANDPHLVVQAPSVWFECHLRAPGYEAAGVALPFAPGVVIGHTGHHAWGLTNVGGDTQDLYLERLAGDGSAALFDRAWERLTVRREEIQVRGRARPDALEVRETRHGPLLDSYLVGIASPQVVEGGIRQTYALRWVGRDHGVPPSTLVRMARAATFAEFRSALRDWACPGQNVVYADADGHIGYQCTGLHPVRRAGDGSVPVPGWTGDHEWEGFVPFEELPWAEDPPDGFLVTANNRIHDDAYPHLITVDFLPPHRSRRITELLAATERHSVETFAQIQRDTVSPAARELLPLLLEVQPAEPRQEEALALLAAWDGDLEAGSPAACIYQAWCVHIARAVLLPRLGDGLFTHYYARRQWTNTFQFQVLPALLANPAAAWFDADGREARDDVLRQALNDALDELRAVLGEDMSSWSWGALHRARFASPLARLPGLTELFTVGVVEVGGDEQTVSQSAFEPGFSWDAVVAPSWRFIADLSDPDRALGAHPTGQSGNPVSPHWDDQLPIWAAGRHHPMPFSRAAVEAEAAATLRLLPGEHRAGAVAPQG